MDKKTLEQIQNAEIELEAYEPNLRALHKIEEIAQRRESLLKSGLIYPIVITEDENNVPQIIDGNLRYQQIRELKEKKLWSAFPISVVSISLEKAKRYHDIQTNQRNYDLFQLAIFAAYISFGRLTSLLLPSFRTQKTIRGQYNGRSISKPGIIRVAYGRPTTAEENYLRILGNGVEY